MRDHVLECAECSRHDTVVRRSLLLFRNLPRIEPSPDFQARLKVRLREAKAAGFDLETEPASRWRLRRRHVAVAASIVAALLVTDALRDRDAHVVQLAPVVATLPESDASATSAVLAVSVPTGMSVWPAIMAASQAQVFFVAAESATQR